MNNKLNDGVGKKIVEALKKQSEGELPEIVGKSSAAVDGLIPNFTETVEEPVQEVNEQPVSMDFSSINTFESDMFLDNKEEQVIEPETESFTSVMQDNTFSDMNFGDFMEEEPVPVKYAPEISDLEMPSNIVILKKLISQLPSGVTRHTGAQIIKQTMEALGISMKNVLKEAQEVQDNLKESAKECQATIQEYKKQIATLEKQSQNYQKQYGALNDLISLFIQTTK